MADGARGRTEPREFHPEGKGEQPKQGKSIITRALLLKIFFIYLRLCWVFDAACRAALVAGSRGYSVFAVHQLLFVVVSLVVEHGPLADRLSSCGPQA